MKHDGAEATSPGGPTMVEVGARKTVGDVIECLGLTGHTRLVTLVCWLIYFISGWTTTLVTFLLHAAAQYDGNWVEITSAGERLSIRDRSLTLFLSGVIAAACNIIMGNLTDFVGRIPVSQACAVIIALSTIGYALAPGKLVLMLCVLFSQVDVSTMVVQSLLAEWVPATHRGILLVSITAIWNLGRLGITLLWAGLSPAEHWMTFFMIAAIFPVVLALYLLVRGQQFESPRWLAVTGNIERCIEQLRLAEATAPAESAYKDELPDGWDDPANLQVESYSGQAVQIGERSRWAQWAELREPKVFRLTALLGFCFFVVGFSWSALFYWLLQYLELLGIDKSAVRAIMLVAPIGKIVSVVVLLAPFVPGQSLVDRHPRTLFLKVGYFGTGLCVAALCMTTNAIALTATMFVCQIFEGFIWGVMHIYVPEAFPTTVRNGATGVTWMLGSIGMIVSAGVAGEMMEIWVYLPMVTSATLSFAGGAACFLLTEERGGSALIDTMGYGTCDDKAV